MSPINILLEGNALSASATTTSKQAKTLKTRPAFVFVDFFSILYYL